MALTQNQTHIIGGTLLTLTALGASNFPTRFVSGPNVMAGQIKLNSGTAYIYPNAVVGASIGGATALIEGWALSATQVVSWVGPANFYLGTNSATATISAVMFYGTGATLA